MLNTQKRHGRKPYTQEEKELYKKQAERMIDEFKRHGVKRRDDIAEHIHVSPTQVSNYVAGRYAVSEDILNELSKTWLLRPEYLLCKDNWRTWEDMAAFLGDIRLLQLKNTLDYLSKLGVSASPGLYMVVPVETMPHDVGTEMAFDITCDNADVFLHIENARIEKKTDTQCFIQIAFDCDFSNYAYDWKEKAPKDKTLNANIWGYSKSVQFDIFYRVTFPGKENEYYNINQIEKLIKQIDVIVSASVPGLLELINEK